MSNHGSILTSRERRALSEMMAPHVARVTKHLGYLPRSDDSDSFANPWSIVFCTYLKAGYLHIIAFPPTSDVLIPPQPPQLVLVDSIPLVMRSRTIDDHLNRVRLAMALFTLQRHVVRFSDTWDDAIWPSEVVYEEYEEVIKPLGLCTPSPTADDSSDDEDWWDQPARDTEISFSDLDDDEEEGDKKIHSDEMVKQRPKAQVKEKKTQEDAKAATKTRTKTKAKADSQAKCKKKAKPRRVHGWAWLKKAYARCGQWENLANMSRVEAWIQDYDPHILEQTGTPID